MRGCRRAQTGFAPLPSATDDCDNLTVREIADAVHWLVHRKTAEVTALIGDVLPH